MCCKTTESDLTESHSDRDVMWFKEYIKNDIKFDGRWFYWFTEGLWCDEYITWCHHVEAKVTFYATIATNQSSVEIVANTKLH